MKLTKYITTACIAALFTGCDYLDFDETTGMTKEEMYSYFGNVTSLSTFVYSQLPQDFGAIGDALRDAATDNAVYTWNQSSVYNVYNGTWSPLKTVDDVWSNYYTAIREANSFLENYSLEVLERFKWNVDYEIDVEKAKMRVHEVRALAGEHVYSGQLLLKFDLQKIRADGYPLTTPVVVTNSDAFSDVTVVASGNVTEGQNILLLC